VAVGSVTEFLAVLRPKVAPSARPAGAISKASSRSGSAARTTRTGFRHPGWRSRIRTTRRSQAGASCSSGDAIGRRTRGHVDGTRRYSRSEHDAERRMPL